MPAEVHLPEAVLGVHVALREEEVVVGLGDELRDAGVVAVDGDGGGEPGTVDAPARRGEGALHGPPAEPAPTDGEHEHRDEQPDEEVEPAVPRVLGASVPTSLLRDAHGHGRPAGASSSTPYPRCRSRGDDACVRRAARR